jgi:hypothetical protein
MFSSALRSSAFIVIASAGHDNAHKPQAVQFSIYCSSFVYAIHRTHLSLAPDIESLLSSKQMLNRIINL